MSHPSIRIIGSYTSPFVRAVRVACEELALPYGMEVTSFFAKNTPEQKALIEDNNPLMRVPVLVDGEENVIDSRIIVTHLIRHYGNDGDFSRSLPISVAQENLLTMVYGILDSAILWFILKNTQPGISLNEGYAARSLARVEGGLSWLNGHMPQDDRFGVTESLLICALEWLEKRAIINWHTYTNLVALHQRHANRESLVKTRIPENA